MNEANDTNNDWKIFKKSQYMYYQVVIEFLNNRSREMSLKDLVLEVSIFDSSHG